MAKKNSTKTATKEARQAAEPRIQTFRGWAGVNFKEAPLGWSPLETDTYNASEGFSDHNDSNLMSKYLMVQNNVRSTPTGSLETRCETRPIIPEAFRPSEYGYEFTGVVYLYENYLFTAVRNPADSTADEQIWVYVLEAHADSNGFSANQGCDPCVVSAPIVLDFFDPNSDRLEPSPGSRSRNEQRKWKCFYVFSDTFIAMCSVPKNASSGSSSGSNEDIYDEELGYMFTGDMSAFHGTSAPTAWPSAARTIPNPEKFTHVSVNNTPQAVAHGDIKYNPAQDPGNVGPVGWVRFCFCWCNKFGFTKVSHYSNTIDLKVRYDEFSSSKYISVRCGLPDRHDSSYDYNWRDTYGIEGLDIYAQSDSSNTPMFVGHVDLSLLDSTATSVTFSWFGADMDISQWSMNKHDFPQSNTTRGVNATHVTAHDGRLYWWGGELPYRLWIGGDPGMSFTVASGTGGGWVDVEPGSNTVIHHTHKFKTYSGSSIVTIMCGNPNTSKVKRYNLLETQLSLSSTNSVNGYMTEEVANVVGCNSDYGSGVWEDGLYSVSRYGLMVTTQAMESNNQLRSQSVSDAIQPIFTDRISERLENSRLICSDGIIYLVFSNVDRTDQADPGYCLDHVILCYDINLKAWYTFTMDFPDKVGSDGFRVANDILNIYNHDFEEHWEGIGVVVKDGIYLIPDTDDNEDVPLTMPFAIETGELAPSVPLSRTAYVSQLEFRFDWFVGMMAVVVEGVDYYGRHIKVEKTFKRDILTRCYTDWIRLDYYLESYRVTMKPVFDDDGMHSAYFRLAAINAKLYVQSQSINHVYGFDALSQYINPDEDKATIHHHITCYNDLVEAIVT